MRGHFVLLLLADTVLPRLIYSADKLDDCHFRKVLMMMMIAGVRMKDKMSFISCMNAISAKYLIQQEQ